MVIVGSVREGRAGDRVGKFVMKKLLERKKHDVEYVDLLNFEVPLLQKAVGWYKPNETVPKRLADMNEKIVRCDAYVLVSAEYVRRRNKKTKNTCH